MSDDKNPNLPALRGQILPPATRNDLGDMRTPTGIIDAVFTGFFARLATRTQVDNNRYLEARQRAIQIKDATARDFMRLQRTLAELDDLDAILQEDQDGRDHGRAVARSRREHELMRIDLERRRLQLEAQQLDQDARIQAMDHQQQLQRTDFGHQLDGQLQTETREKQRLAVVHAETQRLIQERIRDLLIRTAERQHTAADREAEFDELMALQKVQELTVKHQPNENQMHELYLAFKEKQAEIEAYEAGNPERLQAIRGFALSIEPILNRKK